MRDIDIIIVSSFHQLPICYLTIYRNCRWIWDLEGSPVPLWVESCAFSAFMIMWLAFSKLLRDSWSVPSEIISPTILAAMLGELFYTHRVSIVFSHDYILQASVYWAWLLVQLILWGMVPDITATPPLPQVVGDTMFGLS